MRIQLELDELGKEQLYELERVTGLKTHTDLFNAALTLLEWSIQQRVEGRIIASLDEKNMNYKELQMPALEYAARAVKSQAQSLTAAAIK
jgi:hypothetical protein